MGTNALITGWGMYAPSRVMTNDELATMVETSDRLWQPTQDFISIHRADLPFWLPRLYGLNNPAHSRAPPVAAGDGAGCGACAFVPCKHGARAARGSALEHNDST